MYTGINAHVLPQAGQAVQLCFRSPPDCFGDFRSGTLRELDQHTRTHVGVNVVL